MKIGKLEVEGIVSSPPATPTRKVRDFGFTGGNPLETSSVHLSHDGVNVSCSVTSTPGSSNSKMYVSVGVDGAEIRIYREGKDLVILGSEGEMRIPCGRSLPCVMVAPTKSK
ncbi:MAG: hypothetical protein V4690_01100 [Patescibacteria group bacterium]